MKVTIISVTATVFFGYIGLIVTMIMHWMTRQHYGSDAVEKHGISKLHASRLGGVALAICIIFSMIHLISIGHRGTNSLSYLGISWPVWLGSIACFFLGLFEDLSNDRLSPRFRLCGQFFIFLCLFLVAPDLVLLSTGLPWMDAILSYSGIGFYVSVFFSVGFLNAANSSDGANGLLSGIFAITAYIFASELGTIALYSGFYGICLFLIFNVTSGRLFLGDSGAYGIGAAMVLIALGSLELGVVGLPFLASLYFYPCVDFSISLARRIISRSPITKPDNKHLHNSIHIYFSELFESKTLANSATGISIALGSSGFALIGYMGNIIPLTSSDWWLVFCAQCIIYTLVFIALRYSKGPST